MAARGIDHYRDARVLVTGASGFIGSSLAARLAGLGAMVETASRTARRAAPDSGRTDHVADLTDLGQCRALIQAARPDVVFHLASHVTGRQDLGTVIAALNGNLVAAVNLMTALAEHAKPTSVVIAGSSEEPRSFSLAEAESAPYSPYAAAKLGASAYGAFFRRTMGLPVSHARIFMGYGPGQLDLVKLVPYVTVSLLRGQTPRLGSGTRLADFTFIDDIVAGLLTLGVRPEIASLEIGTGKLTSVGDVARTLGSIVDPSAKIVFGDVVDRRNEPSRMADVVLSTRLAGWQPDVGLDAGLRRTVDWFRTRLSDLPAIP